jgi:cellulose synthase/poly-beta-1,6-N-acetylglucosamine synthase-like glycosyltransferase
MIAVLFWLCIAFLLYTYMGYPMLLAALPKKHDANQDVSGQEPEATLLIAAYNEEKCIAQKLENSLSLDYPAGKLQILIAADGSDDKTVEITQGFSGRGVELSYQPARQGKMAAITRTMAAVRGKIVIFSDANNLYDHNALLQLVTPFQSPTVGAVSGAKHILKGDGSLGESEGLYWKYEAFIKKQETRLGSCTGVSGEIFAIRRELFNPPSRGIINDDFYIAMQILRQGYRVVYAPRAKSYESVSLTAGDEISRRTRINVGRYQAIWQARNILPVQSPVLMWQIISHKVFRLLIPFAMIGALILNILAVMIPTNPSANSLFALATPYNWVFLGLQTAFYLFAWVGSLIKVGGMIGKALYLATFLVNSNIAALQGFINFLQRKDHVLWKRVRRAGEEKNSNG